MSDLIDRYLATWNETDPAASRALIAEHWTPRLSYVDPMAEVFGPEALDATIAAVHEQFPGFVFTKVGGVDAHGAMSARAKSPPSRERGTSELAFGAPLGPSGASGP
jgi:hypothetical protein